MTPHLAPKNRQGNHRRISYPQKTLPPRVAAIVFEVSLAHFVPISRIMSRTQKRAAVLARWEAWRRVRDEIRICGRPPSYPQIGRWFGRDHTTILAGVRLSTGPLDSVEIGRGQLLTLEALS